RRRARRADREDRVGRAERRRAGRRARHRHLETRRHPVTARAAGIVHFGPGAFHRAHQADYVDRLLASDPRWGIAAVSLRSPDTIAALARQRGRYTLAILDAEP